MHTYPLRLLLLAIALSSFACGNKPPHTSNLPSLNGAVALRWRGSIDLAVDFNEFFNSDHTIAFWFMPQYPYGPAGPMIAENGTGTFMVGQGDFRWGNGGADTCDKPGDPVLFAKIGTSSQVYIAPSIKPGTWAHLAVVRSQNTFTLYLNGKALSQSITYSGVAPTGNLRLGRRTDGRNHGVQGDPYAPQFYGFMDEVAVFTEALSSSQIDSLRSSGLSGKESNLLAGFLFDFGNKSNSTQLSSLQRKYTAVAPAFRSIVAESRDNEFDAKFLPLPEQDFTLTLPFKAGEVWKVTQGMCDRCVSHNGGTACFSLDMALANGKDSTGTPLYASAKGTISFVEDDYSCSGTESRSSNALALQIRPDVFAVYHHLQENSVANTMGWESPYVRPQDMEESLRPTLQQGQHFGNCGSSGLKGCDKAHMHLGVRTGVPNNVQFPWGFNDYEVSDDGGRTWYFVKFGIPQPRQWVRRRQ